MDETRIRHLIEPLILSVPDFPQEGILFKDVTPLLADPEGFRAAAEWMAGPLDPCPDFVISPEARGFVFGSVVACRIGAGFVPLRKPGKLPRPVLRESYGLEYGSDELQMHCDALRPGSTGWFVDDVLATGGTLQACEKLVRTAGATLAGAVFLLEIEFLQARKETSLPVHSLIRC